MSAQPIAILASGMVTGVGLTAPLSCAAIRCGISNFAETRFMDEGGEWIIGCEVPFAEPWRGRTKLVKMATAAIRECLMSVQDLPPSKVPLLLCAAELERPGLLDDLDETLLMEIQVELGVQFHPESRVIAQGKIGGAVAMGIARQLIQERRADYCLIAGVDSFLIAGTISAYEEQERLLTSENNDGFIPGEAAAAVLVGSLSEVRGARLLCLGVGKAQEQATVLSEEPLKADGLVGATQVALAEAGYTMNDIDFRISDVSGEQYGFKELSLVLNRMLRQRKEEVEIWHPADCIGEVGAASLPANLGVLLAAVRKEYAPGSNALCHGANDTGERVSLVLKQVR